MTDIRQTSTYAQFMKLQGWKIVPIGEGFAYLKKIPFLGYILKYQRGPVNEKILKQIEKLKISHRIFQFIIEPSLYPESFNPDILISRGYKLSKSPYSPTKTILIDLKKTKKQLFNNLHKDVKYALNKKANSPNTIKTIAKSELKTFHDSWKNAANHRRHVPSLASLSNLVNTHLAHSLILTSHNLKFTNKLDHSNLNSGLVIICSPTTAYYRHGFTNITGRSSLSQYVLLWNAILWAKKHKYKYFDLEGIYDSRFPITSWLGFTKFKQKFTGQEILYPGTFIKTNWRSCINFYKIL